MPGWYDPAAAVTALCGGPKFASAETKVGVIQWKLDITQRVNDEEEVEMVSAAREAALQAMVIHPRLGTGWETTVHDLTREVRLRFKLLGLPLPIKKKILFSEVVHVAVVCRESWWSRAGGPFGNVQGFLMFGIASVNEPREPMPTKGWRYDLLMTQKGGRTIRLEVLKSSRAADDLVGQLRHKVGLPPAN